MEHKDFTDEEWRTLQFGPLWAYTVIAAQDAKVDEKEGAALQQTVGQSSTLRGELSRSVLSSLAADGQAMFENFTADPRTSADGLKEIRVLLAKVPEEEANRYKGMLVWIAISVAAASGFIIGDKISDQERSAILILSELIGFSAQDAVMATYMKDVLNALPR